MMTITIVANEKKGYVSIDGGDAVQCSLVKDRENAYSMNIKKLGFARSFISVGALEDKEIELDEATLMTARPSRSIKGPKAVSIDVPEGALDDDDKEALDALICKINDFNAKQYEAKKAAKAVKTSAPRAKLTELEKLERQLSKVLAKIDEVKAASESDDEVVED